MMIPAFYKKLENYGRHEIWVRRWRCNKHISRAASSCWVPPHWSLRRQLAAALDDIVRGGAGHGSNIPCTGDLSLSWLWTSKELTSLQRWSSRCCGTYCQARVLVLSPKFKIQVQVLPYSFMNFYDLFHMYMIFYDLLSPIMCNLLSCHSLMLGPF